MSNRFRSQVEQLAVTLASEILAAIRSSSMADLATVTDDVGVRSFQSEPYRSSRAPLEPAPSEPARQKPERLPRRSSDDIAKALADVVALLTRTNGLRAEQIRVELAMQSKEMPRVLKEGIQRNMLKSKGQKRATTYTVA